MLGHAASVLKLARGMCCASAGAQAGAGSAGGTLGPRVADRHRAHHRPGHHGGAASHHLSMLRCHWSPPACRSPRDCTQCPRLDTPEKKTLRCLSGALRPAHVCQERHLLSAEPATLYKLAMQVQPVMSPGRCVTGAAARRPRAQPDRAPMLRGCRAFNRRRARNCRRPVRPGQGRAGRAARDRAAVPPHGVDPVPAPPRARPGRAGRARGCARFHGCVLWLGVRLPQQRGRE